jgi:hypothetical protein
MSGDPALGKPGYWDRAGEQGCAPAIYASSSAVSYRRDRSFICWGLKLTEPRVEGSHFWKALCTFGMYGPTLA